MKKYLFLIIGILITLSNYAQNIGINTTPASPPTNTLDINGTLRVRGGTPGTGKVLTSDANGVGSWTTSSANYPRISYDAILALPSPTLGDMAFDITFRCLRVYNGNGWICTYQNPGNFIPNMIAIASAGGTSDDVGLSTAVDGLGNVYITGYFFGTTVFGATSISSAGGNDIFVAKYNSVGTLQWVQSASGTSTDVGYGIAVDGLGNVCIAGTYSNTATFGTTSITSAGSLDIFVAKYNSSGTLQWVQSAGGTSVDIGRGIAVDASGNLYVTGSYQGTATFGATPKTSVGSDDIFVAKYNNSGTVQWMQSAGSTNSDNSNSIAVDGSGNVNVTGYYQGTATFGATFGANFITSAGSYDIFVAKYNSSGTLQWVQSAGGTSVDIGRGIAVDASGNLYVTGSYQGTATFGATPKTSVGSDDIFVAKYNNSGTVQWMQSAGSTNSDNSNSIAVDGSGNVYITGYYQGTATFGATLKTSAGSDDIFVAKYNGNGAFQWVQSAGGTSEDRGNSIALDGSGNVYVTGYYLATVIFGATPITSAGGLDIYVARLDK